MIDCFLRVLDVCEPQPTTGAFLNFSVSGTMITIEKKTDMTGDQISDAVERAGRQQG